MLKLEIKLDGNNISEKNKYTIENVYDVLYKLFAKHHFTGKTAPDGTITFYGNGSPQDYGAFGRLITSLKEKEWFMPYVTKWLWYNSDDGENENDFSVEDVLYHYTHRKSAA